MNRFAIVVTSVSVVVLTIASLLILRTEPKKVVDEHGHGTEVSHDDHEGEEPTGTHGGRLVDFGEYIVEVSIFEKDVPPEFRLYVTDHSNKPVTVDPAGMAISLVRPDRTDSFTFRRTENFLQSVQEIAEPHEFTVRISLSVDNHAFETTYFQPETHHHAAEGEGHGDEGHEGGSLGSIALSDEVLRSNRIEIAKAGPGPVSETIELPGEIVLNADKVAHIVPRFAGIAQRVHKTLGDKVAAGEVLAVVQSNQSVAPYSVTSEIGGVVIEKHITPGEFVRDNENIFVVADLSTVWADISIYANVLEKIRVGQQVVISSRSPNESTKGVINYISPIAHERTRTGFARVILSNPRGVWLPGLFITASISVSESTVPIAVPDDAIQMVEGSNVVFVREGDRFHARRVKLGRTDGRTVEILSGIARGEEYAATNSFLLKADFGKSEAAHEH